MAARIRAHFGVRCSMLDVRCFPSVQGFQRANFHFGEFSPWGRGPGCAAIETSPVARPHGQAPNLNPNRNLARLRFLEIKSKITIKSGRKPFGLNSTAEG